MASDPRRPLVGLRPMGRDITAQVKVNRPLDESTLDPDALFDQKLAEFGGDIQKATDYVTQIHGPPTGQQEAAKEPALLGLNALRTVGQGASLGFADEAVGSVRGALTPGMSMGEGIEREREGVESYR